MDFQRKLILKLVKPFFFNNTKLKCDLFSYQDYMAKIYSFDFKEPLQVMDFKWDTVFIGSKQGKIFVHDVKVSFLTQYNNAHT